MRTSLVCVGKIKAPYADADAHYRKLLGRYQPVDVVELREDADLERRVPGDAHVVALDAEGRELDSLAWSRWLEERRVAARDLCFVVGGAKGIPPSVLGRADEKMSLGRHTMVHQLARVVLLEQLFRAAKIAAGEPYHY